MRCFIWSLTVVLAIGSSTALADASAGIFAILDEVALEPNEREPDRVRLRGVFVLPQPISSGLHLRPQEGELYFSLNPDFPEESRADWQVLNAAAGTGKVVGFAEYWMAADPASFLERLPQRPEQSANVSFNTSLVVNLHTSESPVLAEPYPRPRRDGVVTSFDSEYQLCPRFGASSSEIVASIWAAHDPELARPKLPVCEAHVGLIDGSDLDVAFGEQRREDNWAAEAEAMLSERIADTEVQLAQVTIECRYTICHLAFVFPSVSYQEESGNSLVAVALQEVPGFARGGKIEPSLTGLPTRDYWIQRRNPD